jgi:hypothetical protein
MATSKHTFWKTEVKFLDVVLGQPDHINGAEEIAIEIISHAIAVPASARAATRRNCPSGDSKIGMWLRVHPGCAFILGALPTKISKTTPCKVERGRRQGCLPAKTF